MTADEKRIRHLQQNREWRRRNWEKLRPKKRVALQAWRNKMKQNSAWRAEQSRKSSQYQKLKKAIDPVYHVKSKERQLRYYRKLVTTEGALARLREIARQRYHRIKSDPVLRAKYLAAERSRRAKRKQRDPNFALKCHLRARLSKMIREGRAVKIASAVILVGCTLAELRGHIERQFNRGMSWANYGRVWHIDHIIPCAMFDLTEERQQRLCFHYLNLRPLRAEENMRKNSRLLAHAQLPLPLPAS